MKKENVKVPVEKVKEDIELLKEDTAEKVKGKTVEKAAIFSPKLGDIVEFWPKDATKPSSVIVDDAFLETMPNEKIIIEYNYKIKTV